MSGNNPSYMAGGNIPPSRFVMADVSANNQVLVATVGAPLLGISHDGTLQAPLPSATGYAGISGYPVAVWGQGDQASLEMGGTCSAGQLLKTDSSGRGVVASSSDGTYALAIDAGTSGSIIRVQVKNQKLPA